MHILVINVYYCYRFHSQMLKSQHKLKSNRKLGISNRKYICFSCICNDAQCCCPANCKRERETAKFWKFDEFKRDAV